ncbi:MAG: DinB family protein [Dehalococcoidia bacterium]
MAEQADEFARIRGYLIAQAAKLSMPDLIVKVREDSLPLRQAAGLIPASRMADRPADGEWSGAEVWTHILEMNEHGLRAISGILDHGTLPERVSDTISGDVRKGLSSGDDYYAAYLPRREELLARVSRASGDEYPEIKISHSMYGDLSWRQRLLFMRVHDLDHLRQLQSIAAALGS